MRYNSSVHRLFAPTRIDLAGGTIDIWPLYLFHDGAVDGEHGDQPARARSRSNREPTDAIELRSIDTDRRVTAPRWSELDGTSELPLLSLLARHYRLENATLTTRGESPAGAGIAGSSALTHRGLRRAGAMDDAVARRRGPAAGGDERRVPDDPGADRRAGLPARPLRRHRRRSSFASTASAAVAIDVDPRELERRLVLAYTGAPRNSGTNNWDITKRHLDGDRDIFDCFERIRDTAVAMRTALERGRLGRSRPPDCQRMGEPQAARARRDHADDRRPDRPGASRAGATAAKVCGAGGGGCLFCYGPPAARPAIAAALAAGGARVLDFRIETEGLRVG